MILIRLAGQRILRAGALFGKGTLIYPALIVADYRNIEGRTIDPMNESNTIETLEKQAFLSFLDDADFCRIGLAGSNHTMLAYGDQGIVEYVREAALESEKRTHTLGDFLLKWLPSFLHSPN